MTQTTSRPAINAIDVPVRTTTSFYPEPFASRMKGRQKRQLGEFFGLKNFGINLTIWDWIFRTAYWPSNGAPPARMGFDGLNDYPKGVWGRFWSPFIRHRNRTTAPKID